MKWIVAGGKKWERCGCGWTGAGWYNSSKLLELGPEVAGQFCVVVLIGNVKWQDTTWSWSGEPELTEGTWLQLMCCTPSRSRCPKFRSNRVHGFHEGIPEFSGEDGEDGVD